MLKGGVGRTETLIKGTSSYLVSYLNRKETTVSMKCMGGSRNTLLFVVTTTEIIL